VIFVRPTRANAIRAILLAGGLWMRHRRTDLEVLRARCDAAAQMVETYSAARDAASARVLAAPNDGEARADLETAEQLHYLAAYELRRARRALRRREGRDSFVARWTLDLLPR
jgi:hypothetical protein